MSRNEFPAIESITLRQALPEVFAGEKIPASQVWLSELKLLRGGRYTSHHDHRMVMALKVASLGADSPIEIDDEDCVAKSFPQFNALFACAVRR